MTAIAHSPEFAKKAGVPQSVGKDFTKADKGLKFGTGGSTGVTYGGQGQINKQRTRFGSKFGYKLNVPDESLNKYVGKAEGGSVKAFRKGGSVSSAVASVNKQQTHHGLMQLPNVSLNKYVNKKEGGMATSKLFKGKETYKEELNEAKAIKSGKITPQQYAKGEESEKKMASGGFARRAVKGEHPVQKQAKRGAEIVKMAKGGLAGGHKSADGIAVRGKTRAMAPAMRKGGKC